MSFSWVPATHTNTHAHVLTPGSSARKECGLFPFVHHHCAFRQPAFLLPEVSSRSLWAVTENLHTLSDPFYWASSLLSGPKQKQPRQSPKRRSAPTPTTHVHTFSLSITRSIHDGLRAQRDLKGHMNCSPCSPERGGQYW